MRDAIQAWLGAMLLLAMPACASKSDDAGTAGSSAGGATSGGAGAATTAGGKTEAGGTSAGGTSAGETSAGETSVGGSTGTGGDLGVPGPSADCTYEITTSGAREISYAPEPLGCTTLNDGDTLNMVFVKADKTQSSVIVPDVGEGNLGSFPARVQLGILDVGGWETPDAGCEVEVTEQTLLGPIKDDFLGDGRQYRVAGHGSCSEPAKDGDPSKPDLVLGDFSFRVRKTWRD